MVVKVLKDMIEKIEIWLNIVHYCIYKADYKLHMLSNKINPFVLIGKIPAVKRKFEEQGTTHLDVANKVWTDKRFGFGIMISGGALAIIIFFIFWAIFVVLNYFVFGSFKLSLLPFSVCMIVAYSLCHLLVFQKDKYIQYFRQFDKWSNESKRKYGLLTILFVVGSIVVFIYSFKFL